MSTKPWVRMLHHIDTLNVKGVADQLEDDVATGREEETEEHISWFSISPFQGEKVFIFFFHQPCNWGEVLRPEAKVVLHEPIKVGPVSKLLLALELFWDVILGFFMIFKMTHSMARSIPTWKIASTSARLSSPWGWNEQLTVCRPKPQGPTLWFQILRNVSQAPKLQGPKDPLCGWKITPNLWVTVSHETHHVDETMWNDKLWVCSSTSGLNAFWLRIDRNDNI